MKYLKIFATILSWLLVILSFTANVFLLRLILDVRQQAAEAIKLTAQAVGDLQASSLRTVLRVQQEVPVDIPATASSGAVQTKITIDADVPVEFKIADTSVNAALLSTRDFLDRLYTQWQRDPLQALIAPLPQ
jgi:hypothetical protein